MKTFESFAALLAPLRAGLLTCLLATGAGSAVAAGNPYNLIEAGTISVGTMGDAKPYTFRHSGRPVHRFRHRVLPQCRLPHRLPQR
ncbi:hypothetical protein ACVITL_006221 [Rhizobium pisi]